MGRHAKIKDSAAGVVIGYNNSGLPLGARNDHDKLAIIAHESGRQDLKDLFDVLPPLDELKGNEVDNALAAGPQIPTPPTSTQVVAPVTPAPAGDNKTKTSESK